MPVEVILPKVDMDMESAIIESWRVKEGQRVEKGEALFDIITNKAAMEIDSPAAGVVGAISAPVGEPVAVGTVVAAIFADGESIADYRPPPRAPGPAPSSSAEAPAPPAASPAAAAAAGPRAPPLARRTARELSVDLSAVPGSGPRGRVSAADVRAAAEAEGERIPFDPIRRIAAQRLTQSVTTAPHFYLTAEIEMTAFEALLERLRAESAARKEPKPSPTVLLARLVGQVLVRHPLVNASVEPAAMRLHRRVDIAIAMEREGALVTPVLRGAHERSVAALSADFARLRAAVRDRSVKPAELTGGTFTISNLGMFGVDSFTAIINPPQSAILAVGRTQDKPVGRDGQIVLRPIATFSLSSDHRAVDGVTAARFMADLRAAVESPPETL